MAHNAIQIIFTYNAIKYLSNLKLHKVSHRDLYEFIFKSNSLGGQKRPGRPKIENGTEYSQVPSDSALDLTLNESDDGRIKNLKMITVDQLDGQKRP